MTAPEASRRFEWVRHWTLIGLVCATFLLGGASRNDVAGLMVLQPLAVVCGAVFLVTPGAIRWTALKAPFLLLGTLAAIIAVQLIPLPPTVWTELAGHDLAAEVAGVAGVEQPWRPLSLTPDLTLASLVSLVVPFAVLVGLASVSAERVRALLPVIIGGMAISALIGLFQVAGGPQSPFYFYDITNTDSPVGFFSNRNHQAVLLALSWPLLALWASLPSDPKFYNVKRWLAIALGVFMLPMLLATGSRAGLAIGALGLIVAFLLWRRRDRDAPKSDRWSALLLPSGLAAALCVVGATIVLSRDAAMQRATGISFSDESRLQYLPTLLKIAGDFFPIGSGFGSFDPLYRVYEPAAQLSPSYLNHAHNDLVELAITGGVPALILLAVWIGWLTKRAWIILTVSGDGRSLAFARAGLMIIAALLLSSLVDYPLRTPLMAMLITVACTWVSAYAGSMTRRSHSPKGGENALPVSTSPILGRN